MSNESKICLVNDNSIYYRGYDIKDLTAISSFEEVSFLLIYGELPNKRDLMEYRSELQHYRYIPESLKQVLERIPVYAHPIDVLKTACSFYSTISPESKQNDIYRIAKRLIGSFPSILFYWYHYSSNGIRINTQTNVNDSFARHLLKLLKRGVYNNNNNNKSITEQHKEEEEEPILEYVKALDVSLILYAEHGVETASTFSCRLSASTGSDAYSCIGSAIGTMKGKLDDGSSSEAVIYLLQPMRSPQEADKKIMKMINNNQRVIGFSDDFDQRTPIIKEWSKQLSMINFHHNNQSSSGGNVDDDHIHSLQSISERVEEIMFDVCKLNANVDFYNATVFHQSNIPTLLFSAISVIARTTGWVANIIEQRTQSKNSLPCQLPSLIYTGSDPIPFPPINERVYFHNFKLPTSNL
ncbi:hypothetical protein RB653_008000 [Dictyostelium firmibasis]|uniref:Citrate synthase n=1 Tax=Dictyostelium firmibasis TaxID=79012 RepID=A0AAN7YZE4_9MYCE